MVTLGRGSGIGWVDLRSKFIPRWVDANKKWKKIQSSGPTAR